MGTTLTEMKSKTQQILDDLNARHLLPFKLTAQRDRIKNINSPAHA
jgi:hypothetical protein